MFVPIGLLFRVVLEDDSNDFEIFSDPKEKVNPEVFFRKSNHTVFNSSQSISYLLGFTKMLAMIEEVNKRGWDRCHLFEPCKVVTISIEIKQNNK